MFGLTKRELAYVAIGGTIMIGWCAAALILVPWG